jgi:uncharacterized membrane protein YccC
VFTFFLATCISVALAGLYVFAVLPHVHDFPMLVVIFSVPFLVIGTLIPRPRFTLITMLVAVNTATFLSIQSAYEADIFVFLNSNLAGLAGLLFAFVWTRVTRPFGSELAVARLTRSAWRDIVVSASTATISDQRDLYSRMLDRLMQVLPRHASTDSHKHPSIESFRDFRVALNALDLRRARRKLTADVQASIDDVLAGVRAYFQECIDRRDRLPVPPALVRTIDAAVARVAAHTIEEASKHAQAALPGERLLRDTLHALIGVRLSLHPPATETQANTNARGDAPREEPA